MASSSFYNDSSKRPALTSINDSSARKRPQLARLSLTKMAHATRTFWTQAEALEFIAERQKQETNLFANEILYLFSFESQPEGKRRYQVADIDIFIHEYYQMPANQRHSYEIIIDKKPSKLYFDLEFDIAVNPTIDGPILTANFIQFILNFMRKRSDEMNYTEKDVLVLDSTSPKKFSRHLIFQTKDPFLDNIAVGKFVNLALEDIHGCLINHQCSAVNNSTGVPAPQTQTYTDSAVFAKNLLNALESRLSRFDQCECVDDYTQLRIKDMIQFIVNKNDGSGVTWFCDMGVYTKNRAFRLLHSSKFDKKECFTVAPENKWKPTCRRQQRQPLAAALTEPNETERQTFMTSLVYFNGPIRRFIHVDDAIGTVVQPVTSRRRPTSESSYVTEDTSKVTMCYPELVEFMSHIAQDNSTASRFYKAKEVQNDFRWEISFMYAGDYRFCERIGRHHKNNNIYFVVDMREGTYRQKCHDSDCKTFQGVERRLPSHVVPWLSVVNEEWDERRNSGGSPPSMQETL